MVVFFFFWDQPRQTSEVNLWADVGVLLLHFIPFSFTWWNRNRVGEKTDSVFSSSFSSQKRRTKEIPDPCLQHPLPTAPTAPPSLPTAPTSSHMVLLRTHSLHPCLSSIPLLSQVPPCPCFGPWRFVLVGLGYVAGGWVGCLWLDYVAGGWMLVKAMMVMSESGRERGLA